MLPTWDLIITIVFLVISGYNFILQREKVIKLIIAAYIGLALASVWGEAVQSFLADGSLSQDFLEGETTLSSTKIGIFIIFTILLTVKSEFTQVSNLKGITSTFILGLYSVLSSLLIFASIFSFLDESSMNFLLSESNLANFIIKYQLWFFLLPAIFMILGGFLTKKERKRR
ncbi:hypothetical protein ACFL14_02415 [Patescibacteria group bacterium]